MPRSLSVVPARMKDARQWIDILAAIAILLCAGPLTGSATPRPPLVAPPSVFAAGATTASVPQGAAPLVFTSSDYTTNSDDTATVEWISSNPKVLCYMPATAMLASGYIPVPAANGCFVVGAPGSAQVTAFDNSVNLPSQAYTVTVTANPNPSTVFGNGTQGSLVVSSNADWTATGVPGGGFYPQFTNFTVNAGVVLTVPSGVDIRCSQGATINGQIKVANWFQSQDTKSIAELLSGSNSGVSQAAATTIVVPGFCGGGAGLSAPGCPGGGTFGIRAAVGIVIGSGGQISATTATPTVDESGGAGGVVVLVWGQGSTFLNNGSPGINCNGGDANQGRGESGGGGGGIVRLIGPGASANSLITVNGGRGGPAQPDGLQQAAGSCGGSGGYGVSLPITADGTAGLIIPTNVADPTTIVPANP